MGWVEPPAKDTWVAIQACSFRAKACGHASHLPLRRPPPNQPYLRHQLDRHLGLLVDLVQIVDQLGQVCRGEGKGWGADTQGERAEQPEWYVPAGYAASHPARNRRRPARKQAVGQRPTRKQAVGSAPSME